MRARRRQHGAYQSNTFGYRSTHTYNAEGSDFGGRVRTLAFKTTRSRLPLHHTCTLIWRRAWLFAPNYWTLTNTVEITF